jgi:hypothetical protein
MQLVSAILAQRIDLELTHDEFVRQGLEVTDDTRQQAVALLFQGDLQAADQALAGFSDDYREEYVEAISEQLALQEALGDEGYAEWRDRTYVEAEVDVSPRYGTWDGSNGSVTPPEGPSQPAGVAEFPVS